MFCRDCHQFCHHFTKFSQSLAAQRFTRDFSLYRGLEVLFIPSVFIESHKMAYFTHNISALEQDKAVVTLVVTKPRRCCGHDTEETITILKREK